MNLFRRAFTLVELLIVIAIFVILIAIAVPAFSSMLYSSEQSMAENALRIGLGAARDAAVRSAKGQDAAAVFLYEPSTGHAQILACVRAGVIRDEVPANSGTLVEREVFAPAAGAEPVQLPGGWAVRGYAPSGSLDDPSTNDPNGSGWYEQFPLRLYPRDQGNWVFPETGFYDEDQGDKGRNRQTFMIRFEGATGIVKVGDQTPVLVLLPSPSTAFRSTSPWNLYRPDLDSDPARFVRRVASAPSQGTGSLSQTLREKLVGDEASDTVLTKPVGQIAVYNERRLAQAIGAAVDPYSHCLYRAPASAVPVPPPASYPPALQPEFVQVRGAAWSTVNTTAVNSWIEGHLTVNNQPNGQPIESDCRIFTVQRYLGRLQEISGTVGGQGVSQ